MMENDQIKSQIENAKQAFVASKERDREVDARKLDTDHKQTAPQDKQLHEDIMSRVRGLMDEATQTSRGLAADPFIPGQPVAENQTRPFWAQNRVDIPPSEQFGKRQKMQDQDEPGRNSQQTHQSNPPPQIKVLQQAYPSPTR